jgi:hypothetical protein
MAMFERGSGRLTGIAFGLVAAFTLLALTGCTAGNGTSEPSQQTQTAGPSTAEPPTATSAPSNLELWDKAIPVGKSQTRQGLQLTLGAIGLGSPSKVLKPQDQEQFAKAYPNAKSILVVELEAYNPTSATSSLPVYTSTTALVNDEQVDIDMTLSDVTTEILSGARKDMTAIFIVTRYTPDEIHTVRFVLQKTISFTLPESETTYDFTVPVP